MFGHHMLVGFISGESKIVQADATYFSGVLANVEEPGKIDRADFMGKNFMFNMPLEKFGYLAGRSLTTF